MTIIGKLPPLPGSRQDIKTKPSRPVKTVGQEYNKKRHAAALGRQLPKSIICHACGIDKPLDAYYKRSASWHGYCYSCKECVLDRQKKNRYENGRPENSKA